jgi:hypothetical protein
VTVPIGSCGPPSGRQSPADSCNWSPAGFVKQLAGVGVAIDTVGGTLTMEYATVVVTALRAGDRHP